ncbi:MULTISPECIES: hypothetical protein [Delftia]|jgi:hypothetical protein|uniref:hypothetical protein n=1 Tax=Delftia TaxID=80865 RepID=UPI0009DE67EF|nr:MULTISPECIES: hypothetical protein [Delftia]WEL99700.1 hypothetical protein PW274_05295 [Delftia tsuruhatensis]WQM82133.1 hypothetical protein RNT40_26070 [Delftia tsuruhatensis]
MTARWIMASGGQGVILNFSGLSINPDLLALARAQGWLGYGKITINVLSGGDVGALVIPNDFPDESVIIINNGRIGGYGGSRNSRGGTGIYTRRKITVTNNGTIFGGGGGGGDGGDATICAYSSCSIGRGGGGGVGGGYVLVSSVYQYRQTGGVGNQGSNDSIPGVNSASGGRGGDGGAIGLAGQSGSSGSTSGTSEPGSPSYTTPGTGGPAGYYVDGNSFVTWLVAGTRIGNVI